MEDDRVIDEAKSWIAYCMRTYETPFEVMEATYTHLKGIFGGRIDVERQYKIAAIRLIVSDTEKYKSLIETIKNPLKIEYEFDWRNPHK